MTDFAAFIRDLSSPLEPLPTETPADLRDLHGIKAVLFDVYGTLVISGSGDVGVNAAEDRSESFSAACQAVGLVGMDGAAGVAGFQSVIKRHHAAARVRYPEVEIRDVWRDVLADLSVPAPDAGTVERLAVEYEMRTNPTWTMPRAADVLRDLKSRGFLLGIVSNAQFFTPHLFEPLLGDTLKGFGFHPRVRAWSYKHRRAKPGRFLYEHAAEQLTYALRGDAVAPDEVLYVGNDLLNDCTPAQAVGFRTALFAGDARSLRLREGDDRVRDTRPTVTVTDLRQLLECVPAVAGGAAVG